MNHQMSELTEDALIESIRDIDKLSIKPNKLVLNLDAIDLMTDDELILVQKEGLEALSDDRREYLVKELMRRLKQ